LRIARRLYRQAERGVFVVTYPLWYPFHRHAKPARPIFVVGAPRSGKSVLSGLLSLHRGVTHIAEAEGGRIWDPHGYDDPDADHHRTAEALGEQDAPRIATTFEYLRRMRGGQRLLHDHARNSVRIGYIRALFPDALFIHVIRDGRLVVLVTAEPSLARMRPIRSRSAFS